MESVDQPERTSQTDARELRVWEPIQGDHLWVFPQSKSELGSGGEFNIYIDPETDLAAAASFARFSLGVGGDLSEHKHNRSEEMAYLISGEGVVKTRQNGELAEVPIRAGYVWYIPPGTWHAISNRANESLTMVFVTVPNVADGLLSFFRRIGTQPGTDAPPLSREEFARIGFEHDFILRSSTDAGK